MQFSRETGQTALEIQVLGDSWALCVEVIYVRVLPKKSDSCRSFAGFRLKVAFVHLSRSR